MLIKCPNCDRIGTPEKFIGGLCPRCWFSKNNISIPVKKFINKKLYLKFGLIVLSFIGIVLVWILK